MTFRFSGGNGRREEWCGWSGKVYWVGLKYIVWKLGVMTGLVVVWREWRLDTQRNIFEILLNRIEIRLCLPFSD